MACLWTVSIINYITVVWCHCVGEEWSKWYLSINVLPAFGNYVAVLWSYVVDACYLSSDHPDYDGKNHSSQITETTFVWVMSSVMKLIIVWHSEVKNCRLSIFLCMSGCRALQCYCVLRSAFVLSSSVFLPLCLSSQFC